MAKPLLSSTFFTFPKFLLWSLPLFFFLVGSWLTGLLDRTTFFSFLLKAETLETKVTSHVRFP